jgi:hypothetical protein
MANVQREVARSLSAGSGLAVALAAGPDGEANEGRLVSQVVEQARRAVAGPRLWVLDRRFCALVQPQR